MSESPKPGEGRKCTTCKRPVNGHKRAIKGTGMYGYGKFKNLNGSS